ncbi:MAG: glycosyltransferase family 2 protein [Oscillospiraceae bacterium]|jgi:glycosyltransferase involved in cell wall biosynthesis|nr:glycosyltransferase family 2 protein [Oscillospiraceae bacterium]
MPILTVFTPTFNRAKLLARCYASMCRQTCQDFVWLIIDDGSFDETRRLAEQWRNERHGFDLRYIYQQNQGMHGAHNTAYTNITTELNTCIDSDDWMPDDAVEKILTFWANAPKDDAVSGLAGLDVTADGAVIGTAFPDGLRRASLYDCYHRYGVRGDKKLVYRSDLTRQFPYPRFAGEKYIGLDLKYMQLDQTHRLLLFNQPLAVVEYQRDGSSRNMFKQYRRNPRGFLHYRFAMMRLPFADWRFRLRQAMHVPLELCFYILAIPKRVSRKGRGN